MMRFLAARVGWVYVALLVVAFGLTGLYLAFTARLNGGLVPIASILPALFIAALVAAVVALIAARRLTARVRQLAEQARQVPSALETDLAAGNEEAVIGAALRVARARLELAAASGVQDQHRLSGILDYLADGVVIVDADARVRLLNAAAVRLLGLSSHAQDGRPLITVLPDHELVDLARRHAAGGKPAETRHLRVGRSRRLLKVVLTPIDGAGGPEALLLLQDVTELRHLETVRQEFVANVSHELRTPLASIKMMVETLQEDGSGPGLTRDLLGRINLEVDRLSGFVHELLQLSQIESGQAPLQRGRADVAALLRRCAQRLQMQAQRKQVELVVEPDSGLPEVELDSQRIEQVLVNLLQNAVSFTPAGGRVTLAAKEADGEVRISVADTGQGISLEDLPRLFERFYKADKSRRSEGSGLGLAIAKHLVQAHGGRIWAESPGLGRGATFHFTLPLASR